MTYHFFIFYSLSRICWSVFNLITFWIVTSSKHITTAAFSGLIGPVVLSLLVDSVMNSRLLWSYYILHLLFRSLLFSFIFDMSAREVNCIFIASFRFFAWTFFMWYTRKQQWNKQWRNRCEISLNTAPALEREKYFQVEEKKKWSNVTHGFK